VSTDNDRPEDDSPEARRLRNQGKLEHPANRQRLIRDLAAAEHSQSELALRYGVSQQGISLFAARHAERIATVAGKLDDEFAGLWVAQKANRLAVLEHQVDEVLDVMSDPEKAAKAGVQAAEMMRVVQTGLKQIAEELGQLPGRVSVTHSGSLTVQLNGVDVGALT